MKKHNKGDRDTDGSIYKIDLFDFDPIDANSRINKEYTRLSIYKESLDKLIKKHNHLISVRKEIATIPDEYIKNSLRTINVDDMRRLLIVGCDEEINNGLLEISKLEREFKSYIK